MHSDLTHFGDLQLEFILGVQSKTSPERRVSQDFELVPKLQLGNAHSESSAFRTQSLPGLF